MERQAAHSLICFLEKRQIRGINLYKEIQELINYAQNQGCFRDPATVFKAAEWRKFSDKIWDALSGDNGTAERMGRLYTVVMSELVRYWDKRKAACQINTVQGGNLETTSSYSGCPLPPTACSISLPPSADPGTKGPNPVPGEGRPTWPSTPSMLPPAWPPPCCGGGAGSDPAEGTARGGLGGPRPEGDPARVVTRKRRDMWAAIAQECVSCGDAEGLEAVKDLACPVVFNPTPQGEIDATITALDWKIFAQLRATVSQYGVTSEPVKQMLDNLWGTQLLLPADCKGLLWMSAKGTKVAVTGTPEPTPSGAAP
ncbi:uncharacterized protein LOC130584625 isoform X2 [Malurus melanocephalus]|nr:uncharacterized protein LOC130584625 isoform X2 [Malurus melanocephalus]